LECGTKNDKIYRIKKGECVNTIMVEGEHRELTKIKVGDIFGELSILEQNSENQSIVSNTNGELSVVSNEYLGKLFETDNYLARRFYQFIATKLALKLSTLHKKKESNSPRLEKTNSESLRRSRFFFFIFCFYFFLSLFFIFYFIFIFFFNKIN
jgi:CRP-like cAMP-binding protein